jgi:hypothetical protein
VSSETIEQLPQREEKTDGLHADQNGGGVVLSSRQLWVWASIVGLIGGVLALAYYAVMRAAMYLVWVVGARLDWLHLGYLPEFHPVILVVTTVGGLVVGLALYYLGTPGAIAAVVNNIHMERGRIDPIQTA